LTSSYRPSALKSRQTARAIAARWGKFNQEDKKMQNEPNFFKSQIFITATQKSGYSEKCELDTW